MAYLIGQLLVPLAIAAIFGGGLAGWSWHCIAHRDKWAARDAERDRLRNELLTYVGHVPGEGIQIGSAELEALHVRFDAANDQIAALQRDIAAREEACKEHHSRIAELEMALAGAKASAPDHNAAIDRVASLETALREAEARAADLDRRAAQLETDLDAATAPAASAGPGVDVAAIRWRMHQLESQIAGYQSRENIAQIAAPAPAPAPDLEDQVNRQKWQARYLTARVQYLEDLHNTKAATPAPAPVVAAPPVDEEADNRRRWRQRYLEARVAWLEGRARDHAGIRDALMSDVATRDEQIRMLHAQPATVVDDSRVVPLQQRAAELEGALASSQSETAHATRRVAELEAERVRHTTRIAEHEAERSKHLARIAELEARPPAPEPTEDPEVGRLRWQSRYLDNRVRYLEQTIAAAPPVAPQQPPAAPRDDSFAPLAPAGAEIRPAALPAPRDGARDDLRMITGISPKTESTLNSLGIYHFDQVAAWTPANIDWIERYLAFKGRVGREDWVAQAKALAAGGDAAGRRRYAEGEPV